MNAWKKQESQAGSLFTQGRQGKKSKRKGT